MNLLDGIFESSRKRSCSLVVYSTTQMTFRENLFLEWQRIGVINFQLTPQGLLNSQLYIYHFSEYIPTQSTQNDPS
jgi:hypothetical protein